MTLNRSLRKGGLRLVAVKVTLFFSHLSKAIPKALLVNQPSLTKALEACYCSCGWLILLFLGLNLVTTVAIYTVF